MSAALTTAAPTGRKKLAPVGRLPSTGVSGGDAALGHESQNPSSPEGAKDLPNGWRWTTLRDIAAIAGGVTKGQRRRPHERVRHVPYLRVANVQRGYLDLNEMKEIEASESEIYALRLQPGDVLFNEGGDRDKLGRGWVWNGELPSAFTRTTSFGRVSAIRATAPSSFLTTEIRPGRNTFTTRANTQPTSRRSI